ncbi:MAG: nucleotide exchange factor GrpE [Anaerolineae bacterium]|nr:nucleotide exchange factor GrpE [Anaerolineae bacterium]
MVEETRTVNDNEDRPTKEQEVEEAQPDWQDRYLRLAADLENRKRAAERAYAHRAQQAWEGILRDLLPLADNLERALQNVPPAERQTGLYSGVELTLRELKNTLRQHGVERIEALGEPFDPELHDAIGAVPHPTLPPGTVMRVDLPGYLLDGKLLRPARVLVTAG